MSKKQVFGWKVSSQSSVTHKFDVRTVRFGNGYEQRQPRFLKPSLQSWEISITDYREEIEQIRRFLDARRGVESFYWQPPNRERLLVKVSEYSERSEGGRVWTLTATFEEVMA